MDQNNIEMLDKNIDINEAVKEFKKQSDQEELQKPKNLQSPKNSKMVEWLIKSKIVQNEKQANNVLLVFAVVILLFSIYLFFIDLESTKPVTKKPSALIQEELKQMQTSK
jgi:hypothetical protein